MEPSPHDLAQHSYSRCLRTPDFFRDFYAHLLASDESIEPMFSGTVTPRQHKLLQHGIGLLLSFGNNPDEVLLERLAVRHSVNGINVRPALYTNFVDSLLVTIAQHDPKFDETIADAWRAALSPGLEFMKSRYEG